jgi:hypothetical protein
VFLSKIWFFIVTLGAAIALTIALVMPRPAQRQARIEETNRLAVACGVVNILLTDDARNRVELAGSFSRAPEIVSALEAASAADKIDETRMKQVRETGEKVMSGISGRKPDFAWLIDRRGRVVARVKVAENDYGDVAAGRPLVDDALAGYLRDDLWEINGTLYFVSASPVIKRDPPVEYAGAIVLGHKVTNDLATKLVSSLNVDVGFYLGDDDVAGSKTLALDHKKLLSAVQSLKGDMSTDCLAGHPVELRANNEDYTAVVARLPGEAALEQAHYAVFVKKPAAIGFAGTLKSVTKSDLGFGSFPWILVGGAFLVSLGLGIGFMWMESDRPVKRLAADAVKLAKGEKERLSKDAHGGKFGSIARSVNIHIDKLGREAKSAAKNLDSLLGPAPEGGGGLGLGGTIDLLAGALPPSRPGGPAPAAAPPPSDFKFNDPGKAIPTPPPIGRPTSARPGTPPPAPPPTPPRGVATAPAVPAKPAAPSFGLDDDILGGGDLDSKPSAAPASDANVDPYFKQVFDQFLAVKQSCGEPTAGLTLQKFSEKLVKNRDDLMAKTGCKEVKFTVYVKDGKAALKATPVKDE